MRKFLLTSHEVAHIVNLVDVEVFVVATLLYVHAMDGQALTVEKDLGGLCLDHVPEGGVITGVGGSPEKVLSDAFRKDCEQIRLLLVLLHLWAARFDVFVEFILELSDAHGDVLQALDLLQMERADLRSERLEPDVAAMIDVSHEAAPSVDAMERFCALEHRLGLA